MKRAANEQLTTSEPKYKRKTEKLTINVPKYKRKTEIFPLVNSFIPPEWFIYEEKLKTVNLMFPILVTDEGNAKFPFPNVPDMYSYGIYRLQEVLTPLVEKGLRSVFLVGTLQLLKKDRNGLNADNQLNPVIHAIKLIRTWYPNLLIACDVSLRPYTTHKCECILDYNGKILKTLTIERIANISLKYAEAGAHIIAPRLQMFGTIRKINQILHDHALLNRVVILTSAVKQSSAFYGPLDGEIIKPRDKFNQSVTADKDYQMFPNCTVPAMYIAERGLSEGASMIMVKPGMLHLSTLHLVKKNFASVPILVHHLSGEYAMLRYATIFPWWNFEAAALESVASMRRAGAGCIITSLTPLILNILNRENGNEQFL